MDAIKLNCRRKIYPDGTVRQVACDYPIFTVFCDVELADKGFQPKPKDMDNPVRDDSVRRAREAIFDIASLNPFRWFVTWTLDKEKIDRYDPEVVKKKLQNFLENMKRRYDMCYLIVPEYHKDGAIHMHGLVDGNIKMVDSGHVDADGHTIYNMPQWSYGFSTAIDLYGSSLHVAAYLTKYIEKDLHKIFGKFYYSSRGLSRKPKVEYTFIDYDLIRSPEYRRVIGYKYNTFDVEALDDEA